MAFSIGGKVFVHADGSCIATPKEGSNAGQQFSFKAVKSLDFDNAVKAIVLAGFGHAPVAVVAGNGEPEFKIGADIIQEMIDYSAFCGNGFNVMNHDFQVEFRRKGLKTVTFDLLDCVIEKGFGAKSEASGAPSTEFSGKNRKTLINGIDPFVLAAGGGGGGGGGGGLSISAGVNIGGFSLDVSIGL